MKGVKNKCFYFESKRCSVHAEDKYLKWSCSDRSTLSIGREAFKARMKHCVCGFLISSNAKTCRKCLGKIKGDEMRGKPLPKKWRESVIEAQNSRSKEKSVQWKGDNAGYSTIHKILRKYYGNPVSCVDCGLVGSKPNGVWTIHWANISGQYQRGINDWKGLCAKCHYLFDKGIKSKRFSWNGRDMH